MLLTHSYVVNNEKFPYLEKDLLGISSPNFDFLLIVRLVGRHYTESRVVVPDERKLRWKKNRLLFQLGPIPMNSLHPVLTLFSPPKWPLCSLFIGELQHAL